MPRVYDSRSNPHDFCKSCIPSEPDALDMFGDIGDGPDGRGNCFSYLDDHPAYDFEDYTCETCGKLLDKFDD